MWLSSMQALSGRPEMVVEHGNDVVDSRTIHAAVDGCSNGVVDGRGDSVPTHNREGFLYCRCSWQAGVGGGWRRHEVQLAGVPPHAVGGSLGVEPSWQAVCSFNQHEIPIVVPHPAHTVG